MRCMSIITVVGLMVASPAAAAFGGETPVTDTALAEVRGGTALTRRSLVTATTEQFVVQGQLISLTMRGIVENWFADNTVQLITNTAIERR